MSSQDCYEVYLFSMLMILRECRLRKSSEHKVWRARAWLRKAKGGIELQILFLQMIFYGIEDLLTYLLMGQPA